MINSPTQLSRMPEGSIVRGASQQTYTKSKGEQFRHHFVWTRTEDNKSFSEHDMHIDAPYEAIWINR